MDAGTRICSVKTKDADGYERKCGGEHRYIGLLVHDMRRSAAKRLRDSGIHEKLIMDIGAGRRAAYLTATPSPIQKRCAGRCRPLQPPCNLIAPK